MKKLIIITVIITICQLLSAAWLTNEPMTVYQPDGTKIECFASGDEFHNWLHDKDNYTIIQNQKTGNWVWAVNKGTQLVATDYRVDKTNPVFLNIQPKANISNDEYMAKRKKFLDTTKDMPSKAPTQGIINNLVVFIRFSNENEFNQNVSVYDYMLNDSTATGNSMKNYFKEVSYQTLNVNSTFYPYPDANNLVVSYQDIHPRSYFLPYSTSNPDGYQDDERTEREHKLLKRASEAIASLVPTSINLDGDDDGRVDNVCFVIKGSPGAWADLLWPHRWSLFSETAFINGKRVWDFNFQLQTSLTSSGSSVLSHEMFHSLGAPDLYRYNYDGNPIGGWDLMASNSNPPQHMSSYMKYRYSTWVTDIPVISQDGNYSLKSVKSAINNCYRINSPYNANEYFVIEYRNTEMGMFDSQLYGSGLLVYRVNNLYSGEGNAQGPPDELYVYRPGGSNNSDGSIQSAYFSLESGRTQINDATNPNSYLSDGGLGGLNIYNIGSALGDSITFTVQIVGASADDIDDDFENDTFADYDWQNFSESPWTIANTGYQSDHSAKSGTIGDGENSSLEITLNVTFGFVQFYKKTSCENNGDFLKFYIDNELKGSWSGISGWQHIQFPVSNGIHTFKWEYAKNTSGTMGDDAVYVDRIGFPEFAGPVYYPARNLSADIDGRFVNLSWDSPIPSVFYDLGPVVAYKVFCNNELINTVNGTENTMTHGPILGGTQYYKVVVVYQNAESEPSNIISVVIPFSEPLNLTGEVHGQAIKLSWQPPAYVNRGFAGYKVYKNGSSITTGVMNDTTYVDENVINGETYSYTIRAVYTNPNGISPHSNSVSITVNSIDITPVNKTALNGNYPNPFNPSTSISFSLKNNSKVKIAIYNVKGELVKELLDKNMQAGKHSIVWDGKNTNHKTVSAGIYLLRMISNDYQSTRKMIMIK
jgi:M6 family metalloprotease-like protein